jgi:hypothetical protein
MAGCVSASVSVKPGPDNCCAAACQAESRGRENKRRQDELLAVEATPNVE